MNKKTSVKKKNISNDQKTLVKKKCGGNKVVPFLKKLIVPASIMALRYGTKKLAAKLRKNKKKNKNNKNNKSKKKIKEKVMRFAVL